MAKSLLLRTWAYSSLFVLASIPAVIAVGSLGPMLETRFWPVIVDTELVSSDVTPFGVEVVISYEKRRNCRLVELVWENGRVTLPVQPVEGGPLLTTRPVGERESRRLLARGIGTLEGTRSVIFHQCPLTPWLTQSQFYP